MRTGSWWQRIFGLDIVDSAIHVSVTMLVAVMLGEASDNAFLAMLASGAGLVTYAIRRRRALQQLRYADGEISEDERARLEELEMRVQALEGMEHRVLELEERLEFTERVLARDRDHERLPGA
ncbi:MAG: hypothetical protein ACREMH_10205 [Gemmatimonadales bacterium]